VPRQPKIALEDIVMYFAMNRFRIAIGHETAFEDVWKNRDSSLAENPGFKEFKLLRGETVADEGYTLFVSSSIWESRDAFIAWTKSENFRAAPKNAPAATDSQPSIINTPPVGADIGNSP
jgi:heme-degrading monooxygenase HmoA